MARERILGLFQLAGLSGYGGKSGKSASVTADKSPSFKPLSAWYLPTRSAAIICVAIAPDSGPGISFGDSSLASTAAMTSKASLAIFPARAPRRDERGDPSRGR